LNIRPAKVNLHNNSKSKVGGKKKPDGTMQVSNETQLLPKKSGKKPMSKSGPRGNRGCANKKRGLSGSARQKAGTKGQKMEKSETVPAKQKLYSR